ncbi:hypothetical protein L209DRAFT_608602 [Thermothelomyces heterothallicus CBS 203.75]
MISQRYGYTFAVMSSFYLQSAALPRQCRGRVVCHAFTMLQVSFIVLISFCSNFWAGIGVRSASGCSGPRSLHHSLGRPSLEPDTITGASVLCRSSCGKTSRRRSRNRIISSILISIFPTCIVSLYGNWRTLKLKCCTTSVTRSCRNHAQWLVPVSPHIASVSFPAS